MFYYVQHRRSFVRVEVQAFCYYVQTIRRTACEPVFPIYWLYLSQDVHHLLPEVCLQGLQVAESWRTSPLHHPLDLVQSGVTGEHRLSPYHLTNHAPETPYISRLRVLLGPEQDLRSSVPPGGDVVSEDGHGLILLILDRPDEPEVADLGEAILVNEDIGGLDVPVDELSGVQVVQGLGGLVDDVATVLVAEHVLPDEGVEVDVHKLEEDVDVTLVA